MERDNSIVKQDGPSTISTTNTNVTQPQFQTKKRIPRNYDPRLPPDSSTHNYSHKSPQPGPSTSFITNTNIPNHTQ